MRIVELILGDEEITGIEAISVVENPAIEEDFIALKNEEIKLAEVSTEKRILLGALLIPNKPIYRRKGDDEYYIYFSKDTVLKASQLYLQNGNQNKATLEHQHSINGLTLVESWIVEDETHDKSRKYGLNVPVGTWMGAVKVNNEEIWESYVRTKKIKGFSIEGYFADKMERPKEPINDFDEDLAQDMLKEILSIVKEEELESYSDYPSAVKNNAKRGIELNEKVNNKCATSIGKIRSKQISKGEKLSVSVIKRMYSYLSRAEEYYDESDTKACGTISYLLWGGKAGKRWAESKLKELGEIELESMVVNENIAIIDDRVAFNTKEKALEIAKDLGCEGYHEHEFEGQTWYMPCEFHKKEDMAYHKCPKGYKKKDGKCVKMAEVGERGGIRRSKKAPKSDTPNPSPKGKGTAKGDASTTRGAKVSKQDEATLKQKSDDFNKRYKDKLGYGVNVGMLKAVFQRGLGAFNVSHSPRVKSASQWSFARVNAFLYLVKNGRPQNPKYTGDFDLLPKGHPKKNK
jgi:archaellin